MEFSVLLVLSVAFMVVSANSNCPEIYCFLPCEFGFETTENGCKTCQCRAQQGVQQPSCADLRCFIPCDTGYAFDSIGCLTCDCAPQGSVLAVNPSVNAQADNACYRTKCLVPCDGGYETDANGCPTCACVGSGSSAQEANVATSETEVKQLPPNKLFMPSWLMSLLAMFGY